MKAKSGDFKPKKNMDQQILKNNCTPKTKMALFIAVLDGCRQTKNKEIPIITNKVVHTGPNTQFGGVKDGFCKVAYQPGMAGVVKIEPITPAIRQIVMLIISFNIIITFAFFITGFKKFCF